MKFSICTTWAKNKPLEELISLAHSLKLDGIEIWDGHIDDYINRNKNGLLGLKLLLDSHNLVCCSISPYFNLIKEDEAKTSLDCAKKCIEYAKALECKVIRTFIGNKPSKDLTEDERIMCIDGLKNMLQLLDSDSNIFFALETHDNHPTDNADFILYLLRQCKSENLKVLFDGFNLFIDKFDIMKEYKKLEKYVIHCHFKNYLWEAKIPTPLNKGDADFSELISKLKINSSNVYVSFEYFCQEQKTLISDSLEWINSLV